MNRGIKRHKGEQRKREKSKRALLAGGEKWCKLTELFLKSSAAWASTSTNTASTNVSDTAEPAHQEERQDSEEYEPEEEQNEQEEDEEVDMDNCITVRHIVLWSGLLWWFINFFVCIGIVHCSGAVVYILVVKSVFMVK